VRRTILFSRPTLLLSLVIQILGSLVLWFSDIPIAGQVHADSSITQTTGPGDLGTIVTPTGNVYGITEGKPLGNNLFHSFAQFSVDAGDIAQFQTTTLLPNPAIHNILGRVTGQTPSSIFGTIDSASYYPGANLFLMNPNGIIFGPTATLNVGGMATFTTANYLRLIDPGIIHADPAAASMLTSAPVAAFGFLSSKPAAISVQGSTLEIQPGQSISLVGGNQGFTYTNPNTGRSASVPGGVSVTGGKLLVLEPDGQVNQVNIASVASRGEILAGTLAQAPNIHDQSFGDLGTIHVSEKSVIDVNGKGGGTVLIRGGHFVINDSTISANVTGPGPSTNGVESIGGGIDIVVSQDALIQNLAVIETNVADNATPGIQYGGVNITAGHIEIAGVLDPELFPFTGIKSDVLPGSTGGHSGNVELKADSILGKDLGQIETLTEGAGNAGNIKLTATQDIDLNSALIQSSSADAEGNAGNIDLMSASGNISMTAFTQVTSQASISNGQAGAITLSAPAGDISLDQAFVFNQSFEAGPIGGIELTARNLDLKGESSISGDNLTTLTPGNISVTLSNRLSLNDKSSIQTVARGPAPAADLTIRGRTVSVAGESLLTTETFGSGDAGDVTISSDRLTIASGGRIEASTSGAGDGGSIAIKTTGDVTVTGLSADGQVRSGIFAKTLSGGGSGGGGGGSGGGSGGGGAAPKPGSAGDITIDSKNLLLDGGAQIDSSTTSGGAGGSVSITTAENITIAGSSTRLTSDATRGNGKGGNITLVAKNITVRDRASITAATGGKGDAGTVTLTALDQLLLQSAGTITTSTSGSGKGGTIVIQAGQILLDGQGTAITADTLRPFADMTITIDILHPNDGDLVVLLDSPTGTRVALLSRVGGSGDNFTGTQFNDQATMQITSGSAPFTGTFTPREPLGQLNNELVAGDWTLNVRDQATGNVGSLESWTLQIGTQTFQSTGGSSVIPDNDNIRSTITVAAPTVPTVQGVGEAPGIGGNVTINADTVTVQNGATMSATTRGSGQGGTLTVNATGAVALTGSDSGLFTDSEASGTGGNITLTSGRSVTISDDASVSASSTGLGNAGDISINAGQQLDIMGNSSVKTEAAQTSGGNIDIQAIDRVRLVNSTISTSVLGGAGGGGNITIDPNVVVLQNSNVIAQAVQGAGGNITITTPLFLADSSSLVSASSQFGLNGTVTIQSPTSNLSGSLGPLPSEPSQVHTLLTQRCAALANGQTSSFVVAGREQLPTDPGGWLSSPLAFAVLGESLDTGHAVASAPTTKAIAGQSTDTAVSLRRLTPTSFLIASFADSEATGCRS
jgi:filamentous hemagglutinin family protein